MRWVILLAVLILCGCSRESASTTAPLPVAVAKPVTADPFAKIDRLAVMLVTDLREVATLDQWRRDCEAFKDEYQRLRLAAADVDRWTEVGEQLPVAQISLEQTWQLFELRPGSQLDKQYTTLCANAIDDIRQRK